MRHGPCPVFFVTWAFWHKVQKHASAQAFFVTQVLTNKVHESDSIGDMGPIGTSVQSDDRIPIFDRTPIGRQIGLVIGRIGKFLIGSDRNWFGQTKILLPIGQPWYLLGITGCS